MSLVSRYDFRIHFMWSPFRSFFLGMTTGSKMPTEILHTGDLTMEGVQFSKIVFFRYDARLDRRFLHRSALLSNGRGRSLLSPRRMRRRKSTGTSLPTSRKENGRSHDRDRPNERLQPHRHRIRVRSHLLMTCDPLRSKQEMSRDCDEKRDRQPRRSGSAR